MSLYRRPNSNKWWCRFTAPNGKEVRRSAGTEEKRQAQEYEDRLRAELWRVHHLGDKPRRTWQEAVVRWIEEHRHKTTLDDDTQRLRWLDGHLGHLTPGRDFPGRLRGYRARQGRRGCLPGYGESLPAADSGGSPGRPARVGVGRPSPEDPVSPHAQAAHPLADPRGSGPATGRAAGTLGRDGALHAGDWSARQQRDGVEVVPGRPCASGCLDPCRRNQGRCRVERSAERRGGLGCGGSSAGIVTSVFTYQGGPVAS